MKTLLLLNNNVIVCLTHKTLICDKRQIFPCKKIQRNVRNSNKKLEL